MTTPVSIAHGESLTVPAFPASGGNAMVKAPSTVNVPPGQASLAEQVLTAALSELGGHGLTPTQDMKEGLFDLARTLQLMAEDQLPPRFFLSSMDPGVGKTTMVRQFIRVLMGSSHVKRGPVVLDDHYPINHENHKPNNYDVALSHEEEEEDKPSKDTEASILVCVSTLEEVVKLVGGGWCPPEVLLETGVLTADDEVNDMAPNKDPGQARVLITTQQMVRSRCNGKRFRDVEVFKYMGTTRTVKIWDESFLPGEVVTLTTDDLANLRKPARALSNDLAYAVEELEGALDAKKHGARLQLPTIEDLGGPNARAALVMLSREAAEDVRCTAQTLLDMAGQCIPVRRMQTGMKLLLDYRDTIPSDLAPMVILDASGRCRHTYDVMEKARGDMRRLKEVTKDYSNLRLRVWTKGGGKKSFRTDDDHCRIRGIAQTIAERPDEEWLVVHHKDPGKGETFQDMLQRYLPPEVWQQVSYLHWGKHHGTNTYAGVPNVVLAGTFFLPDYGYEGLARLTAGTLEEDQVSPKRMTKIQVGEHAHVILQALCRASVRGTTADGKCKPCRAHIIASKRSGIPELLPKLFPGSKQKAWQPFPEKTTNSVQRALDMIDEMLWLGFHPDYITYKELCEELGIHDRSNFRKTVRNRATFQAGLSQRNLEEQDIKESGRTLKAIVPIESAFPTKKSPNDTGFELVRTDPTSDV